VKKTRHVVGRIMETVSIGAATIFWILATYYAAVASQNGFSREEKGEAIVYVVIAAAALVVWFFAKFVLIPKEFREDKKEE